MEHNKELVFDVKVSFPDVLKDPELLQKRLDNFNKVFKTDFTVTALPEENSLSCRIRATKYTMSDIFGLGYMLLSEQYDIEHNYNSLTD